MIQEFQVIREVEGSDINEGMISDFVENKAKIMEASISDISEVPNCKLTEIKMDNEYFPDQRKFTLNQSEVEQRLTLLESQDQ